MDHSITNKLLAIESRLQEHPFPPQLVIENTSACNQRCLHCSHKEMKRLRRPMTRSLWNRIVEEVAQESPNTEVWPTFYGEALILGHELWDRLDYAAQVGCQNLVLNSNGGLLLRKDHIGRILKSPLKRFILSLDGYSKEVYEKIRVGGRWEEVYAGVEELLRRKEHSGQIYPVITCQFSLMEENWHEVEPFRDHWQSRGAEVKVRPKLEWTATGSIRSSLIDHQTDFRIACPWGNNTMAVLQDGRGAACAVDYEGRYSVGKIGDLSIKAAWHTLGQLRRLHRRHEWDQLPELCRRCRDWQTTGAEYQSETIPGTRPFWFDATTTFQIQSTQEGNLDGR